MKKQIILLLSLFIAVTCVQAQPALTITELEKLCECSPSHFDTCVLKGGGHYKRDLSTKNAARYVNGRNTISRSLTRPTVLVYSDNKQYYHDLLDSLSTNMGYIFKKESPRKVGETTVTSYYFENAKYLLAIDSHTENGKPIYCVVITKK